MFPIREFAAQHRASAATEAASPSSTTATITGEEASGREEGSQGDGKQEEGDDAAPATLRPLQISDLNAALRKVGPTGAAARAFEQRAGARARDQAEADDAYGNIQSGNNCYNHNGGNGGSGGHDGGIGSNGNNNSNSSDDLDAWADALGDYADETAPSNELRQGGGGVKLPSSSQLPNTFSTLLENAMSAAVMQAMTAAAAQAQQPQQGAGTSRAGVDRVDIRHVEHGQQGYSSTMKEEEKEVPTEASSPISTAHHGPCVDPD